MMIDQPSLIKFETEFTAYCNKVDDVSKDREDDLNLRMATIKDCIDSTTLHALCMMGDIDGASSVEDVSVDKVKASFEAASTAEPKDLSERLESVLRSVHYTANKQDPSGGVSKFILSVIKTLDKNNVSEILQDPDMAKKFLDRLVKKFDPPVIREKIKMTRIG